MQNIFERIKKSYLYYIFALLMAFIIYAGTLGSSIDWIISFYERLHAKPAPVSSTEKTQDTVINQPPQTLITATQSFLVLPFDNASNSVPRGRNKETAYLQAARTSLEQLINSLGGKLVERTKLDALLMELEFQRSSGLSDKSKAIQFGQMMGARFIVFGSLDDTATSEVRTTTYQIETTKYTYSVALSVRVVDIKTSNIEYSRTVTESYSEVRTKFVSSDTQDHFPQLIRNAIGQLNEDLTFTRLIRMGG